MSEIALIEEHTEDMKELSRMKWISDYKSLVRLLEVDAVLQLDQEEILQRVMNAEHSYKNGKRIERPYAFNTLYSLIKVARLILEKEGRPTDKLNLKLDVLNNKRKGQEEKNSKSKIDTIGLTTKDLHSKLREIEDPQKYIINYLVVKLNVRNQDLNLVFKQPDEVVEKNENYLILDNEPVVRYIRQNYKTADVYGKKVWRISNKKFYDSVKTLMKQGKRFLLHNNNNNKRVPQNSQNRYIQDRTIERLGTNTITKIITSEVIKNNDIDKLKDISKKRGSNYRQLISNYNVV